MPNKSHIQIAGDDILKKYGASSIIRAGTEEPMGINIAGWTITTSSSTIGDEGQMDALNDSLQELIHDTRRILLPEIVFSRAFVSLKYTGTGAKEQSQSPPSEGEGNEDLDEQVQVDQHVEIKYTAQDALEEWAKCHAHLSSSSSSSYKGVSVIKTVDAKLWEERQSRERQQASSDSGTLFGKGAAAVALQNCSTEFNYDWTYSTPYAGSIVGSFCEAGKCSHSGVDRNMHLLTDQTQPILYFDDVHLYEDDMHDNGYVSLSCKIRVMPTCFFVLLSLFVRVDHVLIRVKESRLVCKFDDDNDQVQVYRDITWKECAWEKLVHMNLPAHIGSWRIEEEESLQQRRIQGMLLALPIVPLPESMHKHSCFSFLKI
jgi:hypothetical protein